MDIKPPILPNLPLPLLNVGATSGLELKLNQLLPAKIIETQILLNTLSVQLGEKSVSLQADLPLKMSPGQTIELQVSKLQPTPEFKLVSPPPASGQPQPRLTLLANSNTGSINISKTIITTAAAFVNNQPAVEAQRFTATVISVTPQKVTLMPTPTLAEVIGQTSQPGNSRSTTATNAPSVSLTTNTAAASLAAFPAPAAKPLVLDIKQLFVAASDLRGQLLSTAPVTQSNPQQVNQGVAADNLKPYQPVNEVASFHLKPQMPVELQLLTKTPVPTFVISLPKDNNIPTLVELQKQLLPMQIPLQPLLQHLQLLARPTLQQTGTVGEILQHLAKAILRDLPSKSALMDPAQLKQRVANSGLFLESKLLTLLKQPTLPPEQLMLPEDLKFKLNKLADTVKQLLALPQTGSDTAKNIDIEVLKQTLTKTQGALAKQTLEQLNSLPRDDSSKQNWIIELPFLNPPGTDSILLEIEQDQAASSESKPKNWSVSITISPPDLGTIHCKLTCYDGSVNSRFWSESAETVEKINGHLGYLKQQFEQKGIVAGFMEAHQGKPIVTDNQKQPPATLLSVKA
jgi:flagellar hook-length control protein FliK